MGRAQARADKVAPAVRAGADLLRRRKQRVAGYPAARRVAAHRALLLVCIIAVPELGLAGPGHRVPRACRRILGVDGIRAGTRDRGSSFTEDANLARWIDAQYLPGLRLYGEWDPEGLLSTLPAIGTCLLGVFAGMLLQELRAEPTQKALLLISAGVVLVAAGYLWGLQFPVVKKIWTSSFVLVAGGYSLLLLGALYLLMDIWGHKAWASAFLWVGANAILLYMVNNLVGFRALGDRLVGGDVGTFLDARLAEGAGSFAKSAVGVALAVVLANVLYRRKIFLRV